MALRSAVRVIEAGLSVLNFPEGTTTDGSEMAPFRRGVFGLARRLDVAVVPVALSLGAGVDPWVGDDWFVTDLLRTLSRRSTVLQIRFGMPMTPARYASAGALAEEARDTITHLLQGSARPVAAVADVPRRARRVTTSTSLLSLPDVERVA